MEVTKSLWEVEMGKRWPNISSLSFIKKRGSGDIRYSTALTANNIVLCLESIKELDLELRAHTKNRYY